MAGRMLQEILTRLPVVSMDLPPKTWPHIASQPTGSSSIGSHKPALIQFAQFSEINNFPDGFTLQWFLSSVFDLVNWTHQKDSLSNCKKLPRFKTIEHALRLLPTILCFCLRYFWPTELEDGIGLAHLHEQRLVLEKDFVQPSLGTSKPLLSTLKLHPLMKASSSLSSSTQNLASLSSGANFPFHRLSPSEAAQRQAQGICYHCNEKYTWDKKCKSKPQLLLFDEDKQYSPVISDF
ncbi:hypothetical protein GOBAR_DD30295 [Gossypium barbadense]|nr:hypothetical protein GOBAR_DD30295 [Gossypium barbadense]